MRIIFLLLLSLLASCSFNKFSVKVHQRELIQISEYLFNNNITVIEAKDIKDSHIKKLMAKSNIDVASIGNRASHYDHEPEDSIVLFIKHGLFKYKRIFYDYSKSPRAYNDTTISHNSYKFKRVTERFYLSSQTHGR